MTLFCGGDGGGARTGTRCPVTPRFRGGLREPMSGGRPRGGGSGGGSSSGSPDLLSVPGSVSPSSSLVLSCPVSPPRLRPPGLGEDVATHVALEVGPRTLRRLSGRPLAAPTPWGSPLRPPGVPPSAASAPAPPPFPCVQSHLSLAHSHPRFVPSAPPPPLPASVSVCLSGSPLKLVASVCVCVRSRRLPAWGTAFPFLAWPPPDPPRRPHSQTQAETHTRTHARPHFPGIPQHPQSLRRDTHTDTHTQSGGSNGGQAATANRGCLDRQEDTGSRGRPDAWPDAGRRHRTQPASDTRTYRSSPGRWQTLERPLGARRTHPGDTPQQGTGGRGRLREAAGEGGGGGRGLEEPEREGLTHLLCSRTHTLTRDAINIQSPSATAGRPTAPPPGLPGDPSSCQAWGGGRPPPPATSLCLPPGTGE
nr:translation initiation factor IF-2-like [Chlorocebus sabaeus]